MAWKKPKRKWNVGGRWTIGAVWWGSRVSRRMEVWTVCPVVGVVLWEWEAVRRRPIRSGQ